MDEDKDLHSQYKSDGENTRKLIKNDNIAVPSFSYDPEGFLRTAAELMYNEGPMCDCDGFALMLSAANSSDSFQRTLEPTIHPDNIVSECKVPSRITQHPESKYSRKITPDEELGDSSKQPSTTSSQEDCVDQGNDTISQSSMTSSYSNNASCMEEVEPQSDHGSNTEMDHSIANKDHRLRRYRLLKPLNAYNYFFRDERDNMVRGKYGADGSLPQPIQDWSDEKKRKLLREHWYMDPLRGRRKHRKKEGAIPFKSLASLVGVRWKSLPMEGRLFYDDVARLDQLHFKKHSGPKNTKHDDSELDKFENPDDEEEIKFDDASSR